MYWNDTLSKVMSPIMGSQFSRLGSKEVPYLAITSGVSCMSGSVSIIVMTRSAAACEDCRSANMRAISRIGSNIDTLYDMNTFSVPIVIVPENTS